jgi:D-sedoheptulose 7-phosphate isomerase
MKTIGLTGRGGGKMAPFCDVLIAVPATRTFEVQELHLPVYHCLCAMVEERFFG